MSAVMLSFDHIFVVVIQLQLSRNERHNSLWGAASPLFGCFGSIHLALQGLPIFFIRKYTST